MLDRPSLRLPADSEPDLPSRSPFLRRLRVRNYKSIGQCDIELRPLTLLVGRNAAGKSNVLDALAFVTDCLQTSIDQALKLRGGLDQVRRLSAGHPRNFLIELDLLLGVHETRYGFEITSEKDGRFAVKRENLEIKNHRGERLAGFRRHRNEIETDEPNPPAVLDDRLYLVNASGLAPFRAAYDALLSMGFYNLNPVAMKELVSPDPGDLLHRDGSNIASVVARLRKDSNGAVFERIQTYLSRIVPGIVDVDRVALGPKETLQFRQHVRGAEHPWKFYAQNMSDGTLRVLGALVAVTQLAEREATVRLVGIEEPETALHPAAAGALMDALEEAGRTQVLITTHSPELLDHADFDSGRLGLLVVHSDLGETKIARADPASLEAIREHLYTAGDLLRKGQLEPDPEDIARQSTLRLEIA